MIICKMSVTIVYYCSRAGDASRGQSNISVYAHLMPIIRTNLQAIAREVDKSHFNSHTSGF